MKTSEVWFTVLSIMWSAYNLVCHVLGTNTGLDNVVLLASITGKIFKWTLTAYCYCFFLGNLFQLIRRAGGMSLLLRYSKDFKTIVSRWGVKQLFAVLLGLWKLCHPVPLLTYLCAFVDGYCLIRYLLNFFWILKYSFFSFEKQSIFKDYSYFFLEKGSSVLTCTFNNSSRSRIFVFKSTVNLQTKNIKLTAEVLDQHERIYI